jgi:integrin beta 3
MGKTTAALSVIPGSAGSPAAPDADLVDSISGLIEAKLAPLRERLLIQQAEIEHLKSRPEPQPGRDGLPGAPGTPGRDGAPGERGADGLGFDDLQVERISERRVVFKFVRGDRVKEFPVDIPAVIYRGVHQEGTAYECGDTVTWAGCLWHANEVTATKPGQGNKAWTLCTKAGRDGKAGQSAYEIACEKGGFRGSEQDWLKSLKGPPGKDGKGFAP